MKPLIDHSQIITKTEELLSEKIIRQDLAREGADHIVIKVTTESSRRFVVKVGNSASTDAFVLKRIFSQKVRVPKIIAESDFVLVKDRYSLVIMTSFEGILLSEVNQSGKYRFISEIINEVKKVHSIKSPGQAGRVLEVIGGKGCSWKKSLRKNLSGENKEFNWNDILKRKGVDKEIVEKALNIALDVLKLLPDYTDLRLLHADLNQSNVFIRDNRLEGIVDWSDAIFGDPLFDFARFRMNIVHRMDKKSLEEYWKTLNLADQEKEVESFYYLVHLLEYVNWFTENNDWVLLEKQMYLLEEAVSQNEKKCDISRGV